MENFMKKKVLLISLISILSLSQPCEAGILKNIKKWFLNIFIFKKKNLQVSPSSAPKNISNTTKQSPGQILSNTTLEQFKEMQSSIEDLNIENVKKLLNNNTSIIYAKNQTGQTALYKALANLYNDLNNPFSTFLEEVKFNNLQGIIKKILSIEKKIYGEYSLLLGTGIPCSDISDEYDTFFDFNLVEAIAEYYMTFINEQVFDRGTGRHLNLDKNKQKIILNNFKKTITLLKEHKEGMKSKKYKTEHSEINKIINEALEHRKVETTEKLK